MFGYIMINQPELKIKDYQTYHAYYCGLCKILKEKYGRIGQVTLTYDMAFLVILLSGLYEPKSKREKHHCMVHPTKSHTMLYNDATRYAADMNILLSYHNLMDDWFDEKNMAKLAFANILKSSYKEITPVYKRQAKALHSYIRKLSYSESNLESDIDKVAGFTGELLGQLFVWKEDIWSEDLYKMGFYLGKFIYLMDAYEDLEKDQKLNQYNPWSAFCNQPHFEKRVKQILTMMMAECCKSFERLPILTNAPILRNILYSGVWNRYYMVKLKKRQEIRLKNE